MFWGPLDSIIKWDMNNNIITIEQIQVMRRKNTVQLNTFIVLNEIQNVQGSFQVMVLYSCHEWSVATSITIFKL